MIMMVVMVYVLVNVPSTGRRCHCVLRKFAFKPTYDLCHRPRLILFPCRVLQLMFLSVPTALLRLDKLRVVALRVVMIVGDSLLMIGSLLVVVGHEINDVAMGGIAAGNVLRCLVVNRWHDHVTVQHVRIRRRVSLVGGMSSIALRCRVVPRCRVSRFPEIRSRFGRRLGKRCVMMTVLSNQFVIGRVYLTRLRRCLAVHVIVIGSFQMRTMR